MDEKKEKNNDELSDMLPTEVMERINLGVVGVSLSMYEEGMTLDELAEVTGIKHDSVKKCLNYLINNRMVKQISVKNTYKVVNFKKMLTLLIELGLIFPISEFKKQPKD
ncbi:MAG: hypothetical protein ACTSVB_11445 [Candidatus Heimdallarchaeaceae archaeon]|uniref:Uncharacterized protein n=1 Tax=Candidatus Heimdallarchaeum endolithica TaxID=2876572 RepID=A0A9Y1BNT1_9ARCH|nr:MAG: hypothetical protein K9W46_07800 [Candidatus Heimdallarchaeum endolithica]